MSRSHPLFPKLKKQSPKLVARPQDVSNQSSLNASQLQGTPPNQRRFSYMPPSSNPMLPRYSTPMQPIFLHNPPQQHAMETTKPFVIKPDICQDHTPVYRYPDALAATAPGLPEFDLSKISPPKSPMQNSSRSPPQPLADSPIANNRLNIDVNKVNDLVKAMKSLPPRQGVEPSSPLSSLSSNSTINLNNTSAVGTSMTFTVNRGSSQADSESGSGPHSSSAGAHSSSTGLPSSYNDTTIVEDLASSSFDELFRQFGSKMEERNQVKKEKEQVDREVEKLKRHLKSYEHKLRMMQSLKKRSSELGVQFNQLDDQQHNLYMAMKAKDPIKTDEVSFQLADDMLSSKTIVLDSSDASPPGAPTALPNPKPLTTTAQKVVKKRPPSTDEVLPQKRVCHANPLNPKPAAGTYGTKNIRPKPIPARRATVLVPQAEPTNPPSKMQQTQAAKKPTK